METICFRIKLKAGSLDEVRKWFQTLKDREAEVLQTLENERAIIESVFLERNGEDFYLIYYMKAENLEFAKEAFKKSKLPIDLYHKECREKFCEETEKLEQLLDINKF